MLRFADKSLKDWELSYQKVNKGTQKVILVLFSFFFFFPSRSEFSQKLQL